jgi:DNA processing protein
MLNNEPTVSFNGVVSPREEFAAYEAVMAYSRSSIRSINREINASSLTPSQYLRQQEELRLVTEIKPSLESLVESNRQSFSIALRNDTSYPEILTQLDTAPALLYYDGDVSLLHETCVSVVGTRQPSAQGVALASNIASMLVEENFAVVSGLARGVDTAAIRSALTSSGKVVACIGTPINRSYPRENEELQALVATCGLVLSHVPILRYQNEPFIAKRNHFPERNEIMAAISKATVIVEASATSGTLTQARACLRLSRQLFISELCIRHENAAWTRGFLDAGAIIFRDSSDLARQIECLF